jgi:hypothetical protein
MYAEKSEGVRGGVEAIAFSTTETPEPELRADNVG